MTKEELFDLADRYHQGIATKKEAQLFEDFLEQMQNPATLDSLSLEEEEKIRIRLLSKINRQLNRATEKDREARWKWLGIAASVLLFLSVSAFLLTMSIGNSEEQVLVVTHTKVTDRGQKSTIYLSDGTVVKLNSESELTYSDFTEANVREVRLSGEAFFDVVKDENRPFVIKSGKLKTTVLGTSFNISSYADSKVQQVTVASGKVQVEQEGKKDYVMLQPNEQASYDAQADQLSKSTVDIKRFISWKDGIIYLDQVTLSEAAKVLEKWYGVQIRFENEEIGSCTLSGTYKNDELKNILEGIKHIKNIDYRFLPDRKILLSGESCK